VSYVFLFCAAILLTLLVGGIVLASLSHDRAVKCPPGWKPNTGYLQHGCIPQ
jgi:hypothetical protein